jgi:hypothetical protein
MIENIFIKILFLIFIGVIVYLIYNFFNEEKLKKNKKCDIGNYDYDIDNLIVIKRTPEYSKLIDNLIDEKSFIFSDDQVKVLKNPQQIFNVHINGKNNNDISNISDDVYLTCKNELDKNTFDFNDKNTFDFNDKNTFDFNDKNTFDFNDKNTFDFNDKNNSVGSNSNNFSNSKNSENFENFNNSENLIDVSDKEYTDIKTMLKNDISRLVGANCFNTGVLKQNIPLIKNYLKNYYQDLYGNKIDANLMDYFVAYYTLINNDDDVGLPVNTLIGTSDFIIPDQYKYDGGFTNAYNIDWNRIINPMTYS